MKQLQKDIMDSVEGLEETCLLLLLNNEVTSSLKKINNDSDNNEEVDNEVVPPSPIKKKTNFIKSPIIRNKTKNDDGEENQQVAKSQRLRDYPERPDDEDNTYCTWAEEKENKVPRKIVMGPCKKQVTT
ncbi:hypothetical protein HCN44_010847 [Aphidius gifuensis]|uniref:Uncharacterized protein n=1 Tax=Aphidius gifuensis TaxID=684658 RepID=A0A835CWF6_APHGI|nr:hypothetical protein HCN44_010847 [Aphidius gifuensis]